jgi:hypothetical protein
MRIRRAAQKYLAGQRIVFARFGDVVSQHGFVDNFDQNYAALQDASSELELNDLLADTNHIVDAYVDRLDSRGLLLPHEVALYKFSAPLYPIRFVNYERKQAIISSHLSDTLDNFISLNHSQLSKLLELVVS